MLSSSDEVYDDSISWNYVLLSVTYKFGLGKWAKIERNDGKQLCVKTSLVDWSVYTWAQWVSKTIRQNRMGFFLTFSLSAFLVSWLSSGWKYLTRRLFWYFLWVNSVTSTVTAYNVDVFKKTWDNIWISFLYHRNQFQTTIKFSL